MVRVTALEAKTRLGALLDRVSRGEEIVITRHEKPVARLVREGQRDLVKVRKAAAGLRALRARIATRPNAKTLTFEEFRSAVAEGQR